MIELDVRGTGQIVVVGHRGALGHAPENTMVSFEQGLRLGADVLELDVHLSSDDQLVVIHDDDVSRTTNGQGRVRAMTAAQIQSLDAGSKFHPRFGGERVPTLPAVLDWARGKIQLLIEIKGGPLPTPGIEKAVVDEVRDAHMLDDVMVISFHHPSTRRVKDLEPRLATGILYSAMLVDAIGAARAARADAVRPSWAFWTSELAKEVHGAGLVAHAWNANDEERMQYLVDMGLDSIGSDYPDRLRAYLDRIGRGCR